MPDAAVACSPPDGVVGGHGGGGPAGRAAGGEVGEFLNDFASADCPADGPAKVLFLDIAGETAGLACGRARMGGPVANVEDRFLIASVSKLYLAVALMQLDEAGRLDIDDPAPNWLPPEVVTGLKGLEGISIAMLLTMTSGIPDYLDDAYFLSSIADAHAGVAARDILTKAILSVADAPRLFEPGTGFDYSNTNYLLAQLVLESGGSPDAPGVH